jgi:hypothetical protein
VEQDPELDKALAEAPVPPLPPAADMETRLGAVGAVRTRRPVRQVGRLWLASLLYGGGLLWVWSVRRDLAGLPMGWVVAMAATWLLGFSALSALALVPPRGHVMPRWRVATGAAAAAALLFPIAGLFAQSAPGLSTTSADSWSTFVHRAQFCLGWGLVAAAVPALIAVRMLRGAVPVRTRWVAAAIGASGGCLGGLMLHFHCPIADGWHVGGIHGGLVALAAGLVAGLAGGALRP